MFAGSSVFMFFFLPTKHCVENSVFDLPVLLTDTVLHQRGWWKYCNYCVWWDAPGCTWYQLVQDFLHELSPCTTNVASSWMFSMHAKDSWLLFSALQVNTLEPEHDMPIARSVLCLFGFICFLMVPVSRKYLCPARPWPLAIEAFRLSAYAIACSFF